MSMYKYLQTYLKYGGYVTDGKIFYFVFNERDYYQENDIHNPSPTPIQEVAVNDDYMDLIVTGDFCQWELLLENNLIDNNNNGVWFSRKFELKQNLQINQQFKFVTTYKDAVRWIEPKSFFENIIIQDGNRNFVIRVQS